MNTPLYNKMVANNDKSSITKAAHAFIQTNQLAPLIQITKFTGLPTNYYTTAIAYDRYSIFKWLYRNKCAISMAIITSLIRQGRIRYLEFLHKSHFDFRAMFNQPPFNAIDIALSNNQCILALYLHYIRASDPSRNTVLYAIGTKDVEAVRYFIEVGGELTEHLLVAAVGSSQALIVSELLELGCPYGSNTTTLAANIHKTKPTDDSRMIVQMLAGECYGGALLNNNIRTVHSIIL